MLALNKLVVVALKWHSVLFPHLQPQTSEVSSCFSVEAWRVTWRTASVVYNVIACFPFPPPPQAVKPSLAGSIVAAIQHERAQLRLLSPGFQHSLVMLCSLHSEQLPLAESCLHASSSVWLQTSRFDPSLGFCIYFCLVLKADAGSVMGFS